LHTSSIHCDIYIGKNCNLNSKNVEFYWSKLDDYKAVFHEKHYIKRRKIHTQQLCWIIGKHLLEIIVLRVLVFIVIAFIILAHCVCGQIHPSLCHTRRAKRCETCYQEGMYNSLYHNCIVNGFKNSVMVHSLFPNRFLTRFSTKTGYCVGRRASTFCFRMITCVRFCRLTLNLVCG